MSRTCTTVIGVTRRDRQYLTTLLRDQGLPVAHVTEQHLPIFARADVAAAYGTRIETVLRGLSRASYARLVDAIRDHH